jgi:hypothetical protein
MTESVRDTLDEVKEDEEEQVGLGKSSIISFNERGCDEIICQFIEDLESSFDIVSG